MFLFVFCIQPIHNYFVKEEIYSSKTSAKQCIKILLCDEC